VGDFQPSDYWRAIILYGRNTATYKIALAHCLIEFAEQGKTRVSMEELAEAFFDVYDERLQNGKPQLMLPGRLTVMERTVELYTMGRLSRAQAISQVEHDAFNDVIPRFHTVDNRPVPVPFYEHTRSGLVLTDHTFDVVTGVYRDELVAELGSRWDLLEAAFEITREPGYLTNDIRKVYLAHWNERTDVTHLIPVLNGYQNGVCFYCGEDMGDSIHVDHVIPRQFVAHDEIWNLVLAHPSCNEIKSDALPGAEYMTKLIERNEYFIASNHPIKYRLFAELGTSPEDRAAYIRQVYRDAQQVIPYRWRGVSGYNSATDPFYRSFVRRRIS
jgi:hypothetical protein